MLIIKKLIDRFKQWLTGNQLLVVSIEDVPSILGKKRLYLVGKSSPWLLIFECPCGCREKIHLNLLPDDSPFWSVYFRNKQVYVRPSIKRTVGCKSHFWITEGKIKWCFDDCLS